MILKEFRNALLEQFLTFVWRQWSALGVLGAVGAEEEWVIDPEPLLVFSLEIARYEPRLFDEILSWLITNGEWLDTARLKKILQNCPEDIARTAGGALQYVSSWSGHSGNRKWKTIIALCLDITKKNLRNNATESLFHTKGGEPYPPVAEDKKNKDFALFSLTRSEPSPREKLRELPVNAKTNLRFLLRALFGVGARAECILYLLTHDGGRPREIADETGFFWLGIQNTLLDMAKSGLVLKRSKGKKVEYWLSQRKWWEFLASSGNEALMSPKGLNWLAVYSALSVLWRTVDELAAKEQEYTDYMKMSKLLDSLEVLEREFSRAGYDMPPHPGMSMPEELRQHEILKFLAKIFGVEVPSFVEAERQREGGYAKS